VVVAHHPTVLLLLVPLLLESQHLGVEAGGKERVRSRELSMQRRVIAFHPIIVIPLGTSESRKVSYTMQVSSTFAYTWRARI